MTANRLRRCLSLSYRQLLGCLLLIVAMAFSTASYSDHDRLTAGKADYSHYPRGGGLAVTAAFGPDGRLWRIVPEKRHVYVDYSTDLGKTFSVPVRVNNEPQRIKVSGENRPGITVDRSGKIYVTFAAEATQPIAQYFSVSSDDGQSFSAPVPLSDQASGANSFEGRLALSPSGKLYSFWLDERDRTDWRQPGNAIYFATIDGQGGVNLVNRKLSGTVCECCRMAVSFDNEDLPVLLARLIYPGDIRDHGLIRVRNNGEAPLAWRVTFDQWELKGCPEHGPAISISTDDRYHISWFTQGSARQGLFYAYSSDRGQHFSSPVPFGMPGRLPSHPDILAQGRHVVLTWTEFDGDKTYLIVMQSSDGGQTWLQPQTIAESKASTDFPFLLGSSKGVFVSWNSKKEGYRLIRIDPIVLSQAN
ncbi:exo-alpha-sialidase [Nitrosovibrio tenuis]|uniref:exo-alpha-sialidase n=1 Tax=Nitrosovibrio tenuis TaxID=1233 RepID=UPI001FE06B64|nr:exo-alpha-sialidase [Nitrosovibrio tenuis]